MDVYTSDRGEEQTRRAMGQPTCRSLPLPCFAISEAVDGQNDNLIGGEVGQASQDGGRVSGGHLGCQLAPSGLGFVSNAVVDDIPRCRLPCHLHALLGLLGDNDRFAGSRH